MSTKSRNTNLDELLFPVVKQQIWTKPDDSDSYSKIPGKIALINAANKQPISVVSDDYEIVSNKQAYEYGNECLRKLFKLEDNHKIDLFNIIRPKSLSFCHMDLICEDKNFEFHKEKFIPFVRVTNSYNKLYRLYFRVGVCRSICENGMIFGEDSIKLSFNHVKGNRYKIQFDVQEQNIDKILNKFKSDLEIVFDSKFDFDYLYPIIYKFIGISQGFKPKTDQRIKFFKNLNNKINELKTEYTEALGDTFYTIYNIITDLSTTGIADERLLITKIHNRQTKAGNWLRFIAESLRNKKFNYEEYLQNYLESRKN